MTRPSRDTDDLERFARLSRAAGFQYLRKLNDALEFDNSVATRKCAELKVEIVGGKISPELYLELGFWYRTLTRSFLSYVEGMLYWMRQLTLHSIERREITVSASERAALSEITYSISVDRKRVDERTSTNRILENFVISFAFFPQVLGSTFRVDYSDHGWAAFQSLVKIRNDITHPKSINHALLQPELPNTISEASVWFFGVMSALFASADEALLEQSHKETIADPIALEQLLALRAPKREQS